jgi:hypothetical protein
MPYMLPQNTAQCIGRQSLSPEQSPRGSASKPVDDKNYLAKELTRLRLKLDKLALYAFVVLAITAACLVYSSLAGWLGSGLGAAAALVAGVATFMALATFYPS